MLRYAVLPRQTTQAIDPAIHKNASERPGGEEGAVKENNPSKHVCTVQTRVAHCTHLESMSSLAGRWGTGCWFGGGAAFGMAISETGGRGLKPTRSREAEQQLARQLFESTKSTTQQPRTC